MAMVLRMWYEILLAFFTALGVVLGGAIFASFAGFFTGGSPLSAMRDMAKVIRLWAIVVAIGGTFPTIRSFEIGLFDGQISALLRQLVIIISALSGAYLAYWLILTLTGGE